MAQHQRPQPVQHNRHSEKFHPTNNRFREAGGCDTNQSSKTANRLEDLTVPHLSANQPFMENSGKLIRLIVLGDAKATYANPKDEIPLSAKNCPPRAICRAVGSSVLEVIATSQVLNIQRLRSQTDTAQTLQQLVAPLISTSQLTTCLKERHHQNSVMNSAPLVWNDSRELGDKIKATLGAIYLTQGITAATLFVCRLLETPLRQVKDRLHTAQRDGSRATPTNPQPSLQLPHGLFERISLSANDLFSIVSATANNHRLVLSSHFTNRVGHPHEKLLGELVFKLCFMTRSVQLLTSAAPNDEALKHDFARKVTDAADSRFNEGFLSFCPHVHVSSADIEALKSNQGALDKRILSALFAELYRTGNLDTGIQMLSYNGALDPVSIKLQELKPRHKVEAWTPFKDLLESPAIAPHLPRLCPPSDEDKRSSRAAKYAARRSAGDSITREQAGEIKSAQDRQQFEDAELKRAELFDRRGVLKMPITPKTARHLGKEKAARLAATKAARTTLDLDYKPSEDYELL